MELDDIGWNEYVYIVSNPWQRSGMYSKKTNPNLGSAGVAGTLAVACTRLVGADGASKT